jgi:hypothetical protein
MFGDDPSPIRGKDRLIFRDHFNRSRLVHDFHRLRWLLDDDRLRCRLVHDAIVMIVNVNGAPACEGDGGQCRAG